MKRICTILFAMLLCIAMQATVFTVNGFKYGTSDGDMDEYFPWFEEGHDAVVLGLENTSYSGELIIPESVNYNGQALTVKCIGNYAFKGCDEITSLSIGNTVRYIGYQAFQNCTKLASFNIPNSVDIVQSKVFYNTAWYNSLPDGLVYKDHVLFGSKGAIEGHLDIPEGTRVIATLAFAQGFDIKSIKIPESVESICLGAFVQAGFSSITIPNSVKLIEKEAFKGCMNLETIVVDKDNAIYDSRNNCNAIIETSTNKLLAGCRNTVIPNTVTAIESFAFYSQYYLQSIVIPNSVKSIGDGAFGVCLGLESIFSQIEEPFAINSAKYGIGAVFDYDECTLFVPVGTKTKYEATDGWKNFKNIVEMTPYDVLDDNIVAAHFLQPDETGKVEIPEKVKIDGVEYTVTEIAEDAFKGNTELTEVTIPGTVTTIGAGAFEGCTNLKAIYVLSPTPASLTTVAATRSAQYKAAGMAVSQFEGIDLETCVLYVPFGSEQAYREAEGWKEFKHIVGVHGETDPALTVTANSYSREYGEENPVFEFTTEGATLDGDPVLECEAMAASAVGTYDIVVKKGGVKNYNDTYVKGTLTVTKAPLTVTVQDAEREQGKENPQFVLTYTGWKNGETESVLTKMPVATTTATKDSPAGVYDIVVSGGDAQNYELSYVSGTLTVTVPSGINLTPPLSQGEGTWYDLQGRKIKGQSVKKGVYVVNGRKVVIK